MTPVAISMFRTMPIINVQKLVDESLFTPNHICRQIAVYNTSKYITRTHQLPPTIECVYQLLIDV